ncbi:hypothetical protein [uncultured Roseovarius sp.]|uniref:hypothetical protein n=1 Tax=uncultured Roseovarius sp. TaxID=293344 RepID=UPI00262EB7EB|nr:hypothetical protein [uncultured Roseovarius sp.]
MKQHRLTSERTTTPADNKPNALDTTAIREPLTIFCHARRAQTFKQKTNVLDSVVFRVDHRKPRGLDTVEVIDVAQAKQVFKRIERAVKAARDGRREGQFIDQRLDALLRLRGRRVVTLTRSAPSNWQRRTAKVVKVKTSLWAFQMVLLIRASPQWTGVSRPQRCPSAPLRSGDWPMSGYTKENLKIRAISTFGASWALKKTSLLKASTRVEGMGMNMRC